MRFLAVCTCAGALAFASGARADELDDLYAEANPRPAKVIEPLHPDSVWYGWQTLLADAPLIAAWATYPAWQGFKGDGGLLFFDMMVFLTASPLVHAVHDGESGVSVGLRLGLPLAGALVGLGVGSLAQCVFCGGSPTAVWGTFDGAVIGAGLASVVDAMVFAWAPRKPSNTTSSWMVAPFGLHGGGGVSAGGTF